MLQNTIVRSAKPGDSDYHLHDNAWVSNRFGSGLRPEAVIAEGNVNIMSIARRSRLRNIKISKSILKQLL